MRTNGAQRTSCEDLHTVQEIRLIYQLDLYKGAENVNTAYIIVDWQREPEQSYNTAVILLVPYYRTAGILYNMKKKVAN